jgi:TolB-like protein
LVLAISTAAVVALGYVGREWLMHSKPAPQAAAGSSIAVLPLANESGDANQQYFSDGLSEDLITALSQFPGLKVIGRTSSFQFRNSRDDSKTIGAKLGVGHLLEGSVRHAGDMVRVSAELIDTLDGSTQWSERYDRPYKDLFALQDDITRAVAGALKTRLLPTTNAAQQNDRPPSGNLEAYSALLEGKYFYYTFSEANNGKAREQFILATQLDPRYALAWSYLSRAWIWAVRPATNPSTMFAKARAAADTAVALAPDLAAAHIARGLVHQAAELDWRGAEQEYRRAVELDPENGDAKIGLGLMLATFGQAESAIELTRPAIARDPLQAEWYGILASYYSGLSRLEAAEEAARKGLELQPGNVDSLWALITIEIQRGNAKGALAAAQQFPVGEDQNGVVALALQIGNDRAAADAALKGFVDMDARHDPYLAAQIYAVRNDANKTFDWLGRAWRARDHDLQGLLYDPFIRRYKNDPRFAAFCRNVGLPTPAEVNGKT